jgi:hypothetical protein
MEAKPWPKSFWIITEKSKASWYTATVIEQNTKNTETT